MTKSNMIGYEQALKITLESISPLNGLTKVSLLDGLNRILSEDIQSRVDSPSIDASMKDGFAVRSADIEKAAPDNPVRLSLVGTSSAGGPTDKPVTKGTAIRILTGAKIPQGADAVVAEEFTRVVDKQVAVLNTSEVGRNILKRGTDVCVGETIAEKGTRITPGLIGIMAAAGLGEVPVFRRPKIAILATGDELVVPGEPLPEGQLYASNLEMLKAWCKNFSMPVSCFILKDQPEKITLKIEDMISSHDALLTSGGAWTGDRDFVAHALGRLGWEEKFHYIRMGPGKPVGFGTLNGKPVFLLPGGPPSNLTAFLQIALPGLLTLSGNKFPCLPRQKAILAETVKCRAADWTQFIFGKLEQARDRIYFQPLRLASRLKSMAGAQGVIAVPEGIDVLEKGALISVQMLL